MHRKVSLSGYGTHKTCISIGLIMIKFHTVFYTLLLVESSQLPHRSTSQPPGIILLFCMLICTYGSTTPQDFYQDWLVVAATEVHKIMS